MQISFGLNCCFFLNSELAVAGFNWGNVELNISAGAFQKPTQFAVLYIRSSLVAVRVSVLQLQTLILITKKQTNGCD
ncbi:hypothetical protein QVD17_06830 [Tagetes erecta]|uniref:Uncharacterized protein n=1 Tax=Tagetes erecta TaxID=13708 RepID=A0AAD8LHM7_TARER|nr:hypothetical protein QVD17_06830 [Tagetes erecta]